MEYSHHIAQVDDLTTLRLLEETVDYATVIVSRTNPLDCEALFKCSDVSPSEIFGYLLARMLGVPVPRFRAVRLLSDAQILGGYRAPANHLAILVERVLVERKMSLEEVAEEDREFAAKYLTLCFFDRFEWPEIISTATGTLCVDLERIGPVMCLDELTVGSASDIEERLECREVEYNSESLNAANQMLDVAERLSLLEELEGAVAIIAEIGRTSLYEELLVHGHPLSQLLTAFFCSCVAHREEALMKFWRVCSWRRPEWRMLVK